MNLTESLKRIEEGESLRSILNEQTNSDRGRTRRRKVGPGRGNRTVKNNLTESEQLKNELAKNTYNKFWKKYGKK